MILLFCITFLIVLLLKHSGCVDDNTPNYILDFVKLEEIDTKKWTVKRITKDEYHIENDYSTGAIAVYAFLKTSSLIIYVVLKIHICIISFFLPTPIHTSISSSLLKT